MPVIGIRLTVIPTFSKTWVNEQPRTPKTTRLAKGSVARRAIRSSDQEERQEEQQGHQHPDETQLLSDHGKDEVGVLLRQERQPLLGPCRKPLPNQPPDPIATLDWIAW